MHWVIGQFPLPPFNPPRVTVKWPGSIGRQLGQGKARVRFISRSATSRPKPPQPSPAPTPASAPPAPTYPTMDDRVVDLPSFGGSLSLPSSSPLSQKRSYHRYRHASAEGGLSRRLSCMVTTTYSCRILDLALSSL
ncbi:hypothetical protein N656DRAFT_72420 [Canariomyces notabilis]|uniref:Uncharacterized protein n=1 Tax=Canariomyces notabilis TaxID=2074819 RepID=A0AAN6TE21_9PEZI|nr:hypothetical protein N656DRAFT_72420 [Canariomyces arenarius]